MSAGVVALTGDRLVESRLWCESSGARQNGSSPALHALEMPWAGRVARPVLEGELAVPSDSRWPRPLLLRATTLMDAPVSFCWFCFIQ